MQEREEPKSIVMSIIFHSIGYNVIDVNYLWYISAELFCSFYILVFFLSNIHKYSKQDHELRCHLALKILKSKMRISIK